MAARRLPAPPARPRGLARSAGPKEFAGKRQRLKKDLTTAAAEARAAAPEPVRQPSTVRFGRELRPRTRRGKLREAPRDASSGTSAGALLGAPAPVLPSLRAGFLGRLGVQRVKQGGAEIFFLYR